MKKSLLTLLLAALPALAFADVTGAYARTSNNGTSDTYLIVTQRGNTLLVTQNILNMIQPGLFNTTQNTNIFSYGIGTFDPATQSAQIAMSSFTQGSCTSVASFKFTGSTVSVTTVSTTCSSGTSSAAQTYQLAF